MQNDAPLTREQRLSSEGTARQQYYFRQALDRARSGPWGDLEPLLKAVAVRWGDGLLSDGQALYVDEVIRARLKPAEKAPAKARSAESYVGTRPIGPGSLERRRRLSREIFVHPQDTGDLTNGEMAVLTVVTEEILKTGRCELPMGKIAALAGISLRWAQQALSKLAALAFLLVERRPRERRRHDTNIVALHPSRGALKARLQRVKAWWRGRGAVWATGRSLVHATRLKRDKRHPLSGDNSVQGGAYGARKASGGWTAKPAPS